MPPTADVTRRLREHDADGAEANALAFRLACDEPTGYHALSFSARGSVARRLHTEPLKPPPLLECRTFVPPRSMSLLP